MPGVSSSSPRPQVSLLSAATAQLLTWVFPSNCLACGQTRREAFGDGVCASCWRSLPVLESKLACERCALPGAAPCCRRCRKSPPPFERTFAAGIYEGSLRAILHAYKFRHFDHLSERFSALLAAAVDSKPPVPWRALIAVPSTARRNRERGFDPAGLLTEELSKRTGIPVRHWLRRTRETEPQSRLPRDRRAENVTDVFEAGRAVSETPILLVDDIMTTGATASSAARALKAAGAPSVSLAVLARTPELAEDSHLEAQ